MHTNTFDLNFQDANAVMITVNSRHHGFNSAERELIQCQFQIRRISDYRSLSCFLHSFTRNPDIYDLSIID